MNLDRQKPRALRAMTALVSLAIAAPLSAAEVVVTQINVSFDPTEVTVYPGDTVRWVYTGGTHTVTSGTDCTPSGLFDSPLTLKNTEFVWTVPASAAGSSISYYCDPHCIFGQTGTINVGVEHVVTQNGLTFSLHRRRRLLRWSADPLEHVVLVGCAGVRCRRDDPVLLRAALRLRNGWLDHRERLRESCGSQRRWRSECL
jgi:plastocyanin